MKHIKWSILAVVLLAFGSIALADSKWNTYEFENEWDGYAYVGDWPDGDYVYGHWTYEYTSQWRWDADFEKYHSKGQYKRTFLSDDGTIKGSGVQNWNYHYSDGPRTYTLTSSFNFIEKGSGLVDRDKLTYHYTYNANGDLVSYKYDWD